ncbi:type I polyketide synthase [Archangium violaceum]|uniref:type I polyketide synthase n=1 Tax=Archangium violaceum TaxID=83451 RepID=UPI002B309989|nr:type I polyketide synthase [Archangium violaceum]
MSQSTPPRESLSAVKLALLARQMRSKIEGVELLRSEPVAVVGLGCRLPGGVGSPEDFWRLLSEGRDAIVEVPRDRWDIDAWFDPDPETPGRMYTRWGGFLDQVDRFDPEFFGISPREAQHMDPQQRLLLEVAWEALEDAGMPAPSLAGSATGVFVGVSLNDYSSLQFADPRQLSAYAGSGSANCIVANRLSYLLDLRGPSMALDTACSSSLVAVHSAVQSLRSGECRVALAGGVNVMLSPEITVALCRSRMLSADGRCKTFDARADGYVRGEGCGVVVLKLLSDALTDKDRILAVIRGSAVNQDGRSNGLTAPNLLAQQALLRQALANAQVRPEEVSLIEAHGTGTSLGDPIEVDALRQVYGGTRSEATCALGSVKTNIGHLEAAAGIAGFIKTVLSLRHQTIPPHLHFRELNPNVPLAGSSFYIPTAPRAWEPGPVGRRLAAVSSFGFGGTNAHVVLEEAPVLPQPAATGVERPAHVLTLSARRPESLRALAGRYAEHLARAPEPSVADVCFSAYTGRAHFEHRAAVVGSTVAELRESLTALAEGGEAVGLSRGQVEEGGAPAVAFLFTGQGSQYVGMGRGLYESQPVFRQALDRCAEVLRPLLERPLLSVMHAKEGSPEAALLDETRYTQPALFALEYALAELWRSWGVVPRVVMGHSVGELAAACVAGVLSLEDGLKLTAERARLMQSLPRGGAMAAVFAEPERVAAMLGTGSEVSIAAINGPTDTTVSGRREAVLALLERLQSEGVKTRELPVSHAFHSALMEPAMDAFEGFAARFSYQAPKLELISNLTGDTQRSVSAAYWRRHAREPVRFEAGMRALHARGVRLFVEVGPSPTLLGLGQRCVPEDASAWVPSLRKGRDDVRQVLAAVGTLYTRGVGIDPVVFNQGPRRRVPVPTYPFQRQRYWLDGVRRPTVDGTAREPEARDEGFHSLEWRPRERQVSGARAEGRWLVLTDARGVGERLASLLEARGGKVVRAPLGSVSADSEGVRRLVREVLAGGPVRGIVHLWSLDLSAPTSEDASVLEQARTVGCGSVITILQAMEAAAQGTSPRLWLVTRGAQATGKSEAPSVAQAPLWGLGRVLALEQPEVWGGLIDLDPSSPAGEEERLAAELLEPDGEEQVALRGQRLAARLVPTAEAPAKELAPKADATYLVTGGLGAIGLHVARWLVTRGARHLVLMGRRGATAEAQEALRSLESAGARVEVVAGDVSVRADVERVLERIRTGMPPLKGIVHSAGALDDGILLRMDPERLARVMTPKVAGAWNLHTLTAGLSLDFFVLFSSSVSLLGGPGQGNYAAANAFLDALAHHRRALGQPALSIHWGPWSEGGMAERTAAGRWTSMGVSPLSPEQGVKALGRWLASEAAEVGVFPINWPVFLGAMPSVPPLLSELAGGSRSPGEASAKEAGPSVLLQGLMAAAAAEREELLATHVRTEVSTVLGLDASRAPQPRQGFFEMGMDSLMAIELRKRLQASLGRTLPATLVFNYPTVESLSRHLAALLAPEPQPAATPAEEVARDAALLAEVEGLSDDEVSSELAELANQLLEE